VLLHRGQHLFRVSLRLDLREDFCHSTLFVDQKRGAFDSGRRPAIHIFFFEDSECFAELLVFVAQHGVGKAIFVFELLEGFG